MSDNNAGWVGPSYSGKPEHRAAPLTSPQYGPAWVADCYGTTHEQRVKALTADGWKPSKVSPPDRDNTARAYFTIIVQGRR